MKFKKQLWFWGYELTGKKGKDWINDKKEKYKQNAKRLLKYKNSEEVKLEYESLNSKGQKAKIDEICDGICIGNHASAMDETLLKKHNITAIVCCEYSPFPPKIPKIIDEKNYYQIPILDTPHESIWEYFPSAYEFIEKCKNN